MGYAIVVDVSVARSAGTNAKPEPQACRRVLAAMFDFGHRVAMSSAVYNEWMKVFKTRDNKTRTYASNISLQWLKNMESSGRVDKVELKMNSELRQRVLQGLKENNRISSSVAPVAKDFHIVETAMSSDKRVLSTDQKMFHHLGNLQEIENAICALMWVNPINAPAETWLKVGAPDTHEYHVCELHR